jgi:hypothetical protein
VANVDVIFKVLDEAHGNIDVAYRALSSAYQLDDTVQFPSYVLCANESELEEHQGRMVVAVAFTSERDFLPDAIEELKELCIARFAEAAGQNGIACLYAGRGIIEQVRPPYLPHPCWSGLRAAPCTSG